MKRQDDDQVTSNPKTKTVEDERDEAPFLACTSFDSSADLGSGGSRNTSFGNSVIRGSNSVESTSKSLGDIEEDAEAIHGEEHELVDDWEATSDALCADRRIDNHDHRLRYCESLMNSFDPFAPLGIQSKATYGGRPLKREPVCSSQYDNASRHERLFGDLCSQHRGILPLPIPCPICCEDLDLTDSSFLPCACGFRLCLFCHKKLLETDGRCPGCRKQYDSNF